MILYFNHLRKNPQVLKVNPNHFRAIFYWFLEILFFFPKLFFEKSAIGNIIEAIIFFLNFPIDYFYQ